MQPIKFENSTDFLSQKQFDAHIKLYEGYIGKINEIDDNLKKDGDRDKANATYSKYRGLKKGESYALNGVILHELYFKNIGGGKTKPQKKTMDMLDECFSGLDGFVKDMIACGISARGWAVLVYEQRSKTFRNILMDTHDYGMITSAFPILALDMYEHSYMLDYGIDKAKYIKSFLDNVNWDVVEKRMNAVR